MSLSLRQIKYGIYIDSTENNRTIYFEYVNEIKSGFNGKYL